VTLSIRTRLTLWYSAVVVLVLVTAAVVGALAQARLGLQRLDDDLERSLATLEGVMRTEFSKGLSLEAAADEASIEVVVPGRTLVLTRDDGSLLETWGLPLDTAAIVQAPLVTRFATEKSSAGELRVLRKRVTDAEQPYRAFIMASMGALDEQQAETVRSMVAGVLIALVAAALGGWVIGRQTLRPLSQMADQVSLIGARDLTVRLSAVRSDDELGLLARAFNGLLDRLATALHQQRQFMADASHELRTPVSVIRTATQVTLTRDARSVDEYRESLVIIGEQANRLSRLVDAMFLLSRAEAQSVPLRPEFLNLDDLLAETARALRVLAAQRGVTLTTEGAQEVEFTGDDALLRQMVGNLLDNAIRHAGPHGVVVASLKNGPDGVVLRVTNDGPGIDAAEQQRIFERFVRVGGSDGAGLGLPIARWIAEAHGGSLVLECSQPGCTAFAVSLPVEAVIDGSSSG
jgi:two-component system OmpR family sensor kinase